MNRFASATLMAAAVAADGFGCVAKPSPVADAPTIMVDGVPWQQVMDWHFTRGLFPTGWSWGAWSLVGGWLEGRDPEGKIAVYFLPWHHGGDFILETRARLIASAGEKRVNVQLLTRDSRQLDFESGMSLFDAGNTVTVRHMANRTNHLWLNFPVGRTLGDGEPHLMRFVVRGGVVTAFLDGEQVYRSTARFPVGDYREPHLAVDAGVGRFEYLRIYEPR